MAEEYVNAEEALIAWSKIYAPEGILFCTELPGDPNELATRVPVVQVTRFGGPKVGPNLERVAMDFDCYHSSRELAGNLAKDISRLYYNSLKGSYQDYEGVRATWSNVKEIAGVGWRNYQNPNVKRYGFTLQLLVKSAKTPA